MGHPKALWQLSNIEMWERFSYYGMRALLAVYVATTFFGHLGDQANAQASLVYGGYTALVYATGIIGGYIADHVLGYQRSILLGAIIMAAGLFVLLFEDLTMVPGRPGADRGRQRSVQAQYFDHDRQAVRPGRCAP